MIPRHRGDSFLLMVLSNLNIQDFRDAFLIFPQITRESSTKKGIAPSHQYHPSPLWVSDG